MYLPFTLYFETFMYLPYTLRLLIKRTTNKTTIRGETLRERRRKPFENLFNAIVSDSTHKLHSRLPPKNLITLDPIDYFLSLSKTNRFKNCFINASVWNF